MEMLFFSRLLLLTLSVRFSDGFSVGGSSTVSRHRRARRSPRASSAEGAPLSTRTGTTF